MLDGNIAFNGPRAGVNFNDGMGGNNTVTRNVLFNFCRWGGRGEGGWCVFVMCVCARESSDHASFNSWDRQVYMYASLPLASIPLLCIK